MRRVLEHVLDRGSVFELGAAFGRPTVTCLARLGGRPVGVLASDPEHYGGGVTADAAEKTARFVDLCDQFHLPVVNFVDVPGFVIGTEAERAGTIRRGARGLFSVVHATVPWVSVLVRKVYGVAGAGHGDGSRLNLRFAWPSGNWGSLPMAGGLEAAYRRELEAAEDPVALRAEIAARLEAVSSPFRTAERFSVEEIIDPRDTRPILCDWAERAHELVRHELQAVPRHADCGPEPVQSRRSSRRRAGANTGRRRGRARRSDGWTQAHVRRLFWRAGFGATPREARTGRAAASGATIRWLLNGGPSPPPRIAAPRVDGQPLDPVNEWGHDVLWWLDRMVRSPRPLQEKMTLFWHDHFATTRPGHADDAGPEPHAAPARAGPLPRPAACRDAPTRRCCCTSRWPNSDQEAPNENFARELMELFTLGRGYTERDIREAARALTGFRADWRDDGSVRTSYDRECHDGGRKRIFGERGRFDWRDVLHLCVPTPPTRRSWSASSGISSSATPLPRLDPARGSAASTAAPASASSPLVGAILAHPALYRHLDAPNMVKSPVVFVAGALRSSGQGIERDSWGWLLGGMGQYPFRPPSVAGWDWGTSLALVELDARALRRRQLPARHPPRRRGGRARRPPAVAAQGGGARQAGGRRPLDLAPDRPRAAAHRPRSTTRERRRATGEPAARPTCASACCASC